jgi:cytosine/adenosine deaminase-related metal-dependent hydrolase
MCADFIAVKLDRVDFSGALHDPLAALFFCNPVQVDYNYVHGRPVVSEGKLLTVELPSLIETHNRVALNLANRD